MMIITIFEQYNRAMRLIVSAIVILLMLHAFSSCGSMQTKLDPKQTYKMEMYFRYYDEDAKMWVEAEGMIALPKKRYYNIEMIAEDKINILSFRSCSREVIVENPKSWMNRKKFIYYYEPNAVESEGACPAEISAVNKDGMLSMGFIDFQDDVSLLPFKNICGENTIQTIGNGVCQERVNSVEKIIFPVEVIAETDPGCELTSPARGKEFTYKIKKGRCLYLFQEVKEPSRVARLITHGYSSIQMEL